MCAINIKRKLFLWYLSYCIQQVYWLLFSKAFIFDMLQVTKNSYVRSMTIGHLPPILQKAGISQTWHLAVCVLFDKRSLYFLPLLIYLDQNLMNTQYHEIADRSRMHHSMLLLGNYII